MEICMFIFDYQVFLGIYNVPFIDIKLCRIVFWVTHLFISKSIDLKLFLNTVILSYKNSFRKWVFWIAEYVRGVIIHHNDVCRRF